MGNVRMLPWTESESSPTTKPVSPYFPQSQAKSSNNGVPDFNDFRQLEDFGGGGGSNGGVEGGLGALSTTRNFEKTDVAESRLH